MQHDSVDARDVHLRIGKEFLVRDRLPQFAAEHDISFLPRPHGIDDRRLLPDRLAHDRDPVAHLLGPTGNLRAPTLRKGKTLVVGFNEEAYRRVLGA